MCLKSKEGCFEDQQVCRKGILGVTKISMPVNRIRRHVKRVYYKSWILNLTFYLTIGKIITLYLRTLRTIHEIYRELQYFLILIIKPYWYCLVFSLPDTHMRESSSEFFWSVFFRPSVCTRLFEGKSITIYWLPNMVDKWPDTGWLYGHEI